MKLRTPVIVAVLALLASIVLLGCGESGDVPLQYKYEAGDSFTYDLNLTMNGQVAGPGIPAEQGALPQDTTINMRMTMAVEEVTDGVATISYAYDSLEMTAGGQVVPVPQQAMPEIRVKVDESGQMISIEGLDQVLPPGFSMSQLPFDPAQFAGQTNLVYPQGGFAKPGDTWEATTNVPVPGSEQGVESKSTGRLVAVSEDDGVQVAEVAFTLNTPMDLTMDLAAMMKDMGLDQLMGGAQDMGDFQFKLTMKGAQDMEGIARVDVSNGMPLDMSADLDIDLVMEVIDAPADVVPEDQRGPISMDMQAELKLNQVD